MFSFLGICSMDIFWCFGVCLHSCFASYTVDINLICCEPYHKPCLHYAVFLTMDKGFSYTQPHLLLSVVFLILLSFSSGRFCLYLHLEVLQLCFLPAVGKSQVFHSGLSCALNWFSAVWKTWICFIVLHCHSEVFSSPKAEEASFFLSARSEPVCWKFDGCSCVGWLLSPLLFLLVCVCFCLCHPGFVRKSLWCM